MFTQMERSRLRSELLELAAHDTRLSGVAVTGSAAADREDEWSDIDLAFGVTEAHNLETVLSDFTASMYNRYRALHHLDVRAGAWIYRVFFLPGTLQVDLAFAPGTEFRPLGPTFRLVSGKANSYQPSPVPEPKFIIGMGWLYALHARSCILRQKPWQAEYMISAVRDHALTLTCLRLGLPSANGRGIDLVPDSIKEYLSASLVQRLDPDELWRALDIAIRGLVNEVLRVDSEFATRIQGDLLQVSGKPSDAKQ
jgi:predicted nucleotidyltransferase